MLNFQFWSKYTSPVQWLCIVTLLRYCAVYIIGMKQYYNISICCNIYYSNTIQYSLKQISIYCTLQYIVIYCNILQYLFLNVINTPQNWLNLDYTLQFLVFLYGYTGCILFTLLPKPIFPYEMSFYENPIKHCNVAIYCNTLKHNTQYSIDPYCFTPST